MRIGTHKSNNFRNRIKEHYLLDATKMNFNSINPAPKDRSIFRKNIGKALLNRKKSKYLETWNIDFTPRRNRTKYGHLREIIFEKKIEKQITEILRNNFTFRFIIIEKEINRVGSKGLERSLIGTVSHCPLCQSSNNWLGTFSPIFKIRESGLWQVQHLKSPPLNERKKIFLESFVDKTVVSI